MVWALLKSIGAILKSLPWQFYAILGAVLVLVTYTLWIDHRAYARGEKHTAEKYEPQIKQLRAALEASEASNRQMAISIKSQNEAIYQAATDAERRKMESKAAVELAGRDAFSRAKAIMDRQRLDNDPCKSAAMRIDAELRLIP